MSKYKEFFKDNNINETSNLENSTDQSEIKRSFPEDVENATEIIGLPRLEKVLVEKTDAIKDQGLDLIESKDSEELINNSINLLSELGQEDNNKKVEDVKEQPGVTALVRIDQSPFTAHRYTITSITEPLPSTYFENNTIIRERLEQLSKLNEGRLWVAPSLDEYDNLIYDIRTRKFNVKVKSEEVQKPKEIKLKINKRARKKSSRRKKRSDLVFHKVNEETKIINQVSEIETENKAETSSRLASIFNRRRKKHKTQPIPQPTTSPNLEVSNVNEKNFDNSNLIFTNVPENILNGGIILFNNLTRQMQNEGSLRVEYLMTVLGALAGYSTQAAAREKLINRLRLSEDQVFSIIETVDGSRYYFGDAIDRNLQKDKHSIWYMTATAAMKLTGKVDSNIDEIVRYTIRNLGKKSFGVPRINKNLRTSHLPQYYVEHIWNSVQPGLEKFTSDPIEWPQIFGVALQRALICTKDILDPNISLRIILESAVPMAAASITPIDRSSEEKIKLQRKEIDQLREKIDLIRNALNSQELPQSQRATLLQELSEKTEQLYQLLT